MSRSVDRRVFLQRTAAAGAAISLARPSWAAAQPPAEKLVVGVMGMGGRGQTLAKLFQQQPNTEVAYVCGVDSNRLAAAVKGMAAAGGKAPRAVGDFRRILDDPAVDVLVCAAPDHWHAPATILACKAGKHVYVEKPCCHNPREGELQVAAARKHKRVVQVGTQRRSYPGLIEAVEKLREGIIGKVLFARGWYNNQRAGIGRGRPAAPPDWLDYDLWQGPAPRQPYRDNVVHYNWHWFWDWGTGELGNNGVHALDLCRWGCGVDFPRQVTCSGGNYGYDDDRQTPMTQVAAFDFGDKMIAWEGRSWHRRGIEGSMFGAAFYGEQGALVMGGNDYKVYDRADKLVEEAGGRGGDHPHIADFLAAVRNQAAPRADIEIGFRSAALCLLGNIAWRSGGLLRCDPANGHILDDQKAQSLWTRQYEPGWEPTV